MNTPITHSAYKGNKLVKNINQGLVEDGQILNKKTICFNIIHHRCYKTQVSCGLLQTRMPIPAPSFFLIPPDGNTLRAMVVIGLVSKYQFEINILFTRRVTESQPPVCVNKTKPLRIGNRW